MHYFLKKISKLLSSRHSNVSTDTLGAGRGILGIRGAQFGNHCSKSPKPVHCNTSVQKTVSLTQLIQTQTAYLRLTQFVITFICLQVTEVCDSGGLRHRETQCRVFFQGESVCFLHITLHLQVPNIITVGVKVKILPWWCSI